MNMIAKIEGMLIEEQAFAFMAERQYAVSRTIDLNYFSHLIRVNENYVHSSFGGSLSYESFDCEYKLVSRNEGGWVVEVVVRSTILFGSLSSFDGLNYRFEIEKDASTYLILSDINDSPFAYYSGRIMPLPIQMRNRVN